MKRFLAAMMICLALAAAAEAPRPEVGRITDLKAGTAYDLDGDGQADEASLILKETDDEERYTLLVGGERAEGTGCALNDSLYALRLNGSGGTLVMVSEDGPSDDELSYVYLFEEGKLTAVGTIGAHPENMRAAGGIITALVRGKVLYTWFHEADFALARGFSWDEEGNFVPRVPTLCSVPRAIYPMGLIVTLKTDLPLRAAMADGDCALTLAAGQTAVLCASDDVKWVYVECPITGEGGWLEICGENAMDCLVDGVPMMGADVFDGLWYAD